MTRTVAPLNLAKVDAHVWRGAKPDQWQAEWLVDGGVRAVLNLEWEQDDDAAFSGILGVKLFRVRDFEPLPWFAPSIADEHVIRALAAIRIGPPVIYVHCRSGENRTGVIIAAYRLLTGMGESLDVVLADFASYRGLWAWGDERYIRSIDRRRAYFREQIACQPSSS